MAASRERERQAHATPGFLLLAVLVGVQAPPAPAQAGTRLYCTFLIPNLVAATDLQQQNATSWPSCGLKTAPYRDGFYPNQPAPPLFSCMNNPLPGVAVHNKPVSGVSRLSIRASTACLVPAFLFLCSCVCLFISSPSLDSRPQVVQRCDRAGKIKIKRKERS